MKSKNFKLIEALCQKRMTQAELVRDASLSSESRLSRIIGYLVIPTSEEVKAIAGALKTTPKKLDLQSESKF